jgi:hypothetical protein
MIFFFINKGEEMPLSGDQIKELAMSTVEKKKIHTSSTSFHSSGPAPSPSHEDWQLQIIYNLLVLALLPVSIYISYPNPDPNLPNLNPET